MKILLVLAAFVAVLEGYGAAKPISFMDKLEIKATPLHKTQNKNILPKDDDEFFLIQSLKSVFDNKGNCLTKKQEDQLDATITMIDNLLDTVCDSLQEASDMTNSESIKEQIAQTEEIIKKVKLDLVSKLKGIAEEACGSCHGITKAVKDSVEVIINAIVDVDPDMKETKWFNTVVTLANTLISVANDICDEIDGPGFPFTVDNFYQNKVLREVSDFRAVTLQDTKACLTKEQSDDIDEIIQLGGNVLNTFSQWLRESESKAQSQELKNIIDKLADMLENEKNDLDKNGEKTVEKLCESCAKLGRFAHNLVDTIERILNLVFPIWKKVPQMEKLVAEIKQFLDQVKEVCKYDYIQLELFKLEPDSCLNEAGVSKFERVFKELETLPEELKVLISQYSEGRRHEDSIAAGFEEIERKAAENELDLIAFSIPSSFNRPCLSCSTLLQEVEDVLMRIEGVLDSKIPRWRDLPLVNVIDDMVHSMIHDVAEYCPGAGAFLRKFTKKYLTRSCLSHTRKGELDQFTREFDSAIEIVEDGLELVKANVNSRFVTKNLQRLLILVEHFKQDVSAGIYDITKESCDICSKVVEEGDALVVNLEKFLDKDIPNWEDIGPIKQGIAMIKSFLNYVRKQCGVENFVDVKCLNKEEKEDIEKIIDAADDFIAKTEEILDDIEKEIPNDQLNELIKKLKAQLDEERRDLDHKAEKSIDKACEICSQSAGNIKNVVARVENTLDEIYPNWKKIPQLRQIFDEIDHSLSEINHFCPFEYKFFELERLRTSERFCLSLKEHCGGVGEIVKEWNERIKSIEENLGLKDNKAFRGQPESIALLTVPLESDNLCFSCNDFVNMAENLINEVEGFLSKVLPEWESLPLMPELDNMVHSLLDDLHKKCSKSGAVQRLQSHPLLVKSSYKCLNHEESSRLNGLLKYVDQGFASFSSQLKEIEDEVSNGEVKQMLESVKANVDSMKSILNDQIVDGAETLCLDCQQISQSIKNVIKQIKSELDEYYPEWKKNKFISSMVDQLDEAWKLFNDYCPVDKTEIMTFDLNVALAIDTLKFMPVTPCVLYMANKGCLDEHEKEKLMNITKEIHLGLDMAANMIKLRADFEPNPVKKLSLLTGAKVIKAIGDDIVTNLTRLADEFCGDCQDITLAVRDSMMVLEEALFDVEPIWKKTPIYAGVKQITDEVFEELKTFCDRSASKQQETVMILPFVEEQCLTPEEKDKLKYYVDQADGLLTYAAETLQMYADELAEGPMKEQLEEMAKAVKAVDRDLIQNFTKIADEACGSCLDVIKALKDLKNSVEAALSDVDPDWRSDSNYNEIALAVEAFIGLMEELCPSARIALLEAERCDLSQSEIHFMKSVARAQEMALNFRVKLIGTSKFVEKQQRRLLKVQHDICPKRSEFFGITIENSLNHVILNEQGWTPKTIQNNQCSGDAEFLYGAIFSSLDEFSLTLTEAIKFEGAVQHKRQLMILKDMMELAKEEVDRVLLEAMNPCSICGEVARTLSDALYEVKEMIEEMVPVVAKNPIFEALIDGLESVLKLIHDYCPQEAANDLMMVTVSE